MIWLLLVGLFWAIAAAVQDGVQRLRRLHQIPCDRCAFCSKDYRLPCTVHPTLAFTEAAIDCRDYEPIPHPAANPKIGLCSKPHQKIVD